MWSESESKAIQQKNLLDWLEYCQSRRHGVALVGLTPQKRSKLPQIEI